MFRIRSSHAVLSLPLLFPFGQATIKNTNYFVFPAQTEGVGTYIPNDTLKVSWVSEEELGGMTVRCKEEQSDSYTDISTIPGATSSNPYTLQVSSNWTFPCYLLLSSSSGAPLFSSGFLDSSPNTRPATTFTAAATPLPSAFSSLCAAAVPTATQTSSANVDAWQEVSTANPSNCTDTGSQFSANISMSNRTSIGVGIVVGICASALTAGLWFWISKLMKKKQEKARVKEDDRSRRMLEEYKAKDERNLSQHALESGGWAREQGGYYAVDVLGERDSRGGRDRGLAGVPVRTVVQRDSLRGRGPLEMESQRGPYEMLGESRLKR